MSTDESRTFLTPFSPAYWRLAVGELKSLKNIIIAAILIAVRIEAAKFFIPLPVMGTQHIYITFLITAVGAAIYGPW